VNPQAFQILYIQTGESLQNKSFLSKSASTTSSPKYHESLLVVACKRDQSEFSSLPCVLFKFRVNECSEKFIPTTLMKQ